MKTAAKVGVALLASILMDASAVAQFGQIGPFDQIHPSLRAAYRRAMLSPGYKDKVVRPGTWKINGFVGGAKPFWMSEKLVLRRAAELTKAYGKPLVRVSVKNATRQVGVPIGGAEVTIEASAVDERDGAKHCESRISVFTCQTFPAEVALAETTPYLKLPTDK